MRLVLWVAALERNIKKLVVRGDSALVIYQLKGEWETRDAKLVPYYQYISGFIEKFEEITLQNIPMESNQMVDALASLEALFRV